MKLFPSIGTSHRLASHLFQANLTPRVINNPMSSLLEIIICFGFRFGTSARSKMERIGSAWHMAKLLAFITMLMVLLIRKGKHQYIAHLNVPSECVPIWIYWDGKNRSMMNRGPRSFDQRNHLLRLASFCRDSRDLVFNSFAFKLTCSLCFVTKRKKRCQ